MRGELGTNTQSPSVVYAQKRSSGFSVHNCMIGFQADILEQDEEGVSKGRKRPREGTADDPKLSGRGGKHEPVR